MNLALITVEFVVTPLHTNIQVVNFQKYEHVFICPITEVSSTHLVYIVVCVHPLQGVVVLCTLLYSTL